MNQFNINTLSSSCMVYDYNLPKEYTGTTSNARACYIKTSEYGASKCGQIIAPTPTTVTPKIFENATPHAMPQDTQKKTECNYNRNYYNPVLYGNSNEMNHLANKNSVDSYRMISMNDSFASCNGTGMLYQENKLKKGFNDVSGYYYF